MSKSTHHSFDISLAKKFGIEAAIIIHHFQHWINHNRACGKNFRDGKTWSYQTRKEISSWFAYLSPHQVRRITDKLVKEGVLIKGNYNKRANDDTIWYAFVDEDKYLEEIDPISDGRSASQKRKRVDEFVSRVDESATPLPDTKTDTLPSSSKKDIAQTAKAASQRADISYSRETGQFEGITQEDLQSWVTAYSSVNISQQIAKAIEWLKSNPSKANKRLWRKFLTSWLDRANEKAENQAAYRSNNTQTNEARRASQLNNANEGKGDSPTSKIKIIRTTNAMDSK